MRPRVFGGARLAELLLFAVGVVVLAVCVEYRPYGDGAARYETVRMLAEAGEIRAPRFPLLGPLFSLPLHWIGQLARYNLFLLVAAAALLYGALRDLVEPRVLSRFLILLLVGSMFPSHARFFHGETFTVALVASGLAFVAVRGRAAGWALVAPGVANTPATIGGLVLVAARRAWTTRHLRVALVVVAAALLVVLDLWVRTGQVTRSGYEGDRGFPTLMPFSGRPGFSYPFFFGALSILFSFGKGLVWFAPGLLLPAGRRLDGERDGPLRECQTLWLLFVAGLVLVYAGWWSWYGGWSFGPRFFLFASVPASFSLALYLDRPGRRLSVNLGVLAVLALSVWVGAAGAVFDLDGLEVARERRYALEHLVWHVPEFSALWHPFVERRELGPRDSIVLVYAVVVFFWLGRTVAADCLRQTRDGVRRLARARGWKW